MVGEADVWPDGECYVWSHDSSADERNAVRSAAS